MTQDFFLGQLRLIMVAVIAFCTGKGWLSTDTTTLLGAVLVPFGLLFGPWLWSIYHNINMKLVPRDSVAIDSSQAAVSDNGTHAVITGATTLSGGTVAKVVGVLLFAFVLSAFLAGGAQAQVKLVKPTGDISADAKAAFGGGQPSTPRLTGNLEKDAQAVWKKIVDASLTDLTYASALAGSANTNGGTIRKQCWDAIIALNKQVNGASLKNPDGTPMVKPDPSLFSDVEILAETIDNLSPQGALFTSCAGASQLAKTNVLTFINAAMTGAAGIAAMPIIPGL